MFADLSALAISSPASYVVAVALPALDAIIPVLPSEAAVIGLGVATAGSADPRIAILIMLAAAGAFAGDNLAYLLGRRYGGPVARRFLSGERGSRRRAWAERALDQYGARLIIACRFIPGGRTAVTLTSGLIGFPRRRFVAATSCAAVIWAGYAFFLGRIGGKVFEQRPWAGLLLGLAGAVAISVLIEILRRTGIWHWLTRPRGRPAGSGVPGVAVTARRGPGR
ncbi:MAG TPA: DedA family protein [Streptosporangiaceae bacterium]|nr:DedA family protein [Streptosporangiaceae bacterium]